MTPTTPAAAGAFPPTVPCARARRRVRLLVWALAVTAGVLLLAGVKTGLAVRALRHRLAEGAARNTPPPMTRPADRPWDGSVPLYWGGTFRILGVCENADHPRWWNADGSAIGPPLNPHKFELPPALGIGASKPLDRQICYKIITTQEVHQGNSPSLKIEGASESLTWAEGVDWKSDAFVEFRRYVISSPGTPTLTLRGTLNDNNYQTFAIARAGQKSAGPLKIEYAGADPRWTDITVRGEWQFDARLAVIRRNGHRAFPGASTTMNGPLGNSLSARFYCPMSDIAGVHFQMCGIQRFVVTGIAANPGARASPLIATEHLSPILAGQPPLNTAPLPNLELDDAPAAIRVP